MNDKIVKAFLSEEKEILDESILLDSLVQKLKGLELGLRSRISKDDPKFQRISQGFTDLENLIATLNS